MHAQAKRDRIPPTAEAVMIMAERSFGGAGANMGLNVGCGVFISWIVMIILFMEEKVELFSCNEKI
jgi:hypothetical protein